MPGICTVRGPEDWERLTVRWPIGCGDKDTIGNSTLYRCCNEWSLRLHFSILVLLVASDLIDWHHLEGV